MSETRFEELLGRLLEGDIASSEAEELAHALELRPDLRLNLRRHLVLWEVWSQAQSEERSEEAFVRALRLRQRLEGEDAGVFADEVMSKLGAGSESRALAPTAPTDTFPRRTGGFVTIAGTFFGSLRHRWVLGAVTFAALSLSMILVRRTGYEVFVSDEASGAVTIIDPRANLAVATIPVGRRPRAIHFSPSTRRVYIAVTGAPPGTQPELDDRGNPIFGTDFGDSGTYRSDDGIAVVGVDQRRVLHKFDAGSDPEQFAFSRDGKHIILSNEDSATARILNVESGRIERTIAVQGEPEGVGTTPDGKVVYVTCETAGEIFVLDAPTGFVITHFNVGGRPRSVDFLPDGSRAFIPSESTGQMHLIDSRTHRKLKSVDLPKGSRPMCVKVDRAGRRVYVSTGRAGTVLVLDARTAEVLNSIRVGARPWGMAISPDDRLLYTANGLSDDVSVVDLIAEKEITRIKVGRRPWGVAVVPTGKCLGLREVWPWGQNGHANSTRSCEQGPDFAQMQTVDGPGPGF
jgi:YVTN family beta-propeller protein